MSVEGKEVLKGQISQLIAEMERVEIKTDEEYGFGEDWLRRNKATQKIVADAFEPERVEAKARYDEILETKKQYIVPLEASEKIIRQKMSAYATAKEQARREEQRRLDDIARREAEEKRLAEAQVLADAGKIEKADALLDKAIRPTTPKVEAAIGKMREVWTVEIIDESAFFAGLASGVVDSKYITVNYTALNSTAQALKDKYKIPGTKAVQKFVPVL